MVQCRLPRRKGDFALAAAMMRAVALTLSTFSVASALAADVEVQVSHLRDSRGSIAVALFSIENARTFPDAGALANLKQSLKESKPIVFRDLPTGDYALAAFHDANDDGRMNTNFIGIPKEGIAFSNNPTLYFGAPSFAKCRFRVEGNRTVELHLKYY